MGKRAYQVWAWAEKVGKKIAWPCEGGSGAGPALANGFTNMLLFPILIWPALPFFGLAALAKLGFKRQQFVIIPVYDPSAFENPNINDGKGVDLNKTRFVVIPDGKDGYTFPACGVSKGDWPDPSNLGIKSVTWIEYAWDDHHEVYGTYNLMMDGTVPEIPSSVLVPLSELCGAIPDEVFKRISQRPRGFEYWKGSKFDLKYPPSWTV